MTKIDFSYETTEERPRAYLQVPEIERLRWLDELVRFALMLREAPLVKSADAIEDDR